MEPKDRRVFRHRSPHRARAWRHAACALALLLPSCEGGDPLERVRQQQARGEYAETLEPLRELLAERRDGEVYYLYGIALMGIGEYGAATWPLRQALEDPEWRGPAALYLIRAALVAREYKDVVDLTNRLLEDDPDDVAALLYRAQAQAYWRRDAEAAVADARRVLDLEPERLEAYEPLIIALLALERHEEARKELAEVGRRLEETDSPASSLAWHCSTSAIFAAEAGALDQARKTWNDCLERYPADPTVVASAVEFFDLQNDRARSLEVVRTAHEEAPEEWAFRVDLAHRLAAAGDRAAGEAKLREATEVEDARLAHAAGIDLADFLHAMGEHAEAAEAMEQAIERLREVEAPRPIDLFRWADALVLSGQLDEALEVAAQIGVTAQTELIRGRVAQKRDDPVQALEHFDEALRLWPDNPWAHYYTALAAENAGQFDRALEEYRYAIRIDPSATDARTRAAKLLTAQNMLMRAYHLLFVESGKHPLEAEGERFGMYLLARAAVPAQLQDALLRLAQQEPDKLPRALAGAAEGVAERAGPRAAVDLLRGAPVIDYRSPSSAPALRALVELAHESGQRQVAQEKVDAALAAAPDAPAFQGVLGLHLELGGDLEGARTAYERAVAGWPGDAASWMGLGRVALVSDAGEAAGYFDRAAAVDPSNPEPQLTVARILRAAGQPGPARRRLKKLLADHPHQAEAAVEIVELDLAEGEVSPQTVGWAQRALRFSPSPEGFERLARVHEELGNEPEQQKALERAERLRERLAAQADAEEEGG